MSTIQSAGVVANAPPPAVSSSLVDAWFCRGVGAATIVSDVDTGQSLDLTGTNTHLDDSAYLATFAGENGVLTSSGDAGFHQAQSGESMLISVRVIIDAQAPANTTILDCRTTLSGWNLTTITGTGRVLARYGEVSSDNLYLTAGDVMTAGTTAHFIFAFDNSDESLYGYLDSVAVSGSPKSLTAGAGTLSTTSTLNISAQSTSAGDYFIGKIHDLQIYRTSSALPSNMQAIADWMYAHPNRFLPASLFP